MGTLFKRSDRGGKAGRWYAQYVGPDGKRIAARSTGTNCKKTAKQILNHWEADTALRRQGVIDPQVERMSKQSQRPIAEHIDEFKASLETLGRSAKHVHETMRAINTIIETESWVRLSDLALEGCDRDAKAQRKTGASNRTIEKRFIAIKQFSKWAFESGRLQSHPLAGLKKPSPEVDRHRTRRMLLPDEWKYLRKAILSADVAFQTLTAADRVLIYEIAIQTGLRASEIRVLTPGKLHLSQKPPFILVPSRSTKNKKPARQYIGRKLASDLQSHAETRTNGYTLFDWPKHLRTAEAAVEDLGRARQSWIDEAEGRERKKREQGEFLSEINGEGEQFDFHALRHTCGAWLAMAGEHPGVIQKVMRHSTVTLTMDRYGHLFPASESDAITRMAERFFGDG